MIEKRYYTAATLEDALSRYETEYGMTSAEFFQAHRTDADRLEGIPGFERSVWASLWQELLEFDAPDGAASFAAADESHTFRLAV
jgi:hypothetical protein